MPLSSSGGTNCVIGPVDVASPGAGPQPADARVIRVHRKNDYLSLTCIKGHPALDVLRKFSMLKSKQGDECPHNQGENPMSIIGQSLGGACLVVALIGASPVVHAQDQNPATPKDVIVARKTLMNAIGTNMYPIDEMLETGKIDLGAARIPLESISAMLMAFPNLFPPSTNLWKPGAARDPATDTLADAAVWESRSFFYREAMAASKYAFEASRAQNAADFRKSARDLRLTCDGCHSTYQHKD